MRLRIERLSTGADLILKIGTALVMIFAAAFVTTQHQVVVLTSNDQR